MLYVFTVIGVRKNDHYIICFIASKAIGETPIDIRNIMDIKNRSNKTNNNNNLITTNDNNDQKENIPILNLYQPINTRPIVINQDFFKLEKNNPELNKLDTNMKDTYSSTKNKDISSSIINTKKIYHLEYVQKNNNNNSIEYYLNNILKYKTSIFPSSTQINTSLFKPSVKSFGGYNKNASGIILSNIQDDDDSPFNISEHIFPFLEEENMLIEIY